MEIDQLKLLAGRVRDLLQHSPQPVGHNKSLDLVSALPGLRNWPEVVAFPDRVASCRLDLASAGRLAFRLKRAGTTLSPEELLEALAAKSARVAEAPQIWPTGPKPGIYVTTSQEAINALLQRYEDATDGALVYAERAGRDWDGSIDLGEGGLWSNGLARVPSGTLIVVGPLEFDQQSWKDSADHIHMAALHALSSGHRVAVLIETPTPESMCEDVHLMITSVQETEDHCEEALMGVVTDKGELLERSPFARARPRVKTAPTPATLDAIPVRARRKLEDALSKRSTGLLLFGSSTLHEHSAIDLVAGSLAMTQHAGPAARVMPRHRSTPAKDWLVPEAIKVLPFLPSIESAFEQGYRRIVFSRIHSGMDSVTRYADKALLICGTYASEVEDAYMTTLSHPVTNEGDSLGKLIAILTVLRIPGKRVEEIASDLFVMPEHMRPAPTLRYEDITSFLQENRSLKWQDELRALLDAKRITVAGIRKSHPRSNHLKEFLSQRSG